MSDYLLLLAQQVLAIALLALMLMISWLQG
jgi:hypothetical protein